MEGRVLGRRLGSSDCEVNLQTLAILSLDPVNTMSFTAVMLNTIDPSRCNEFVYYNQNEILEERWEYHGPVKQETFHNT